MPRHATKTSFTCGHKNSDEAIEKQRTALKERYRLGLQAPSPKACEHCDFIYLPTGWNQRWCKVCVPDIAALRRMYKFNLSRDEIDGMIARQGGQCALCPKWPTEVDHDHITNRVRGMLCGSCNLRLSGLDDLVWKARAEAYRAT